MELTQLQWAKTGYVLNEDAEGKERWTNCYHNAKAVYYSESEVHPDITGAKAILSAKKKQYRLAMKERQQKIKEIVAKNKDYEEKRDEGLPLPSDALENVELPVYARWQEAYSGNNAVVLIFDTETTGLKADYNSLLQLSWQVVEVGTWEVLSRKNFYFKYPSNPYRVESKAILANNLTPQRLNELGTTSLQTALYIFNQDLKGCDLVVGHNVAFDLSFVEHASYTLSCHLHRYLLSNLSECATYCTMLATIDLCRLPNKKNPEVFKRPALIELAAFLGVGTNDLNLHDSACDVELTKRCFRKLVEMKHDKSMIKFFLEKTPD